jgi:DNA-binding transcriptional ArsR family regulator
VHDATTDAAIIRAWWKQWPDANIGIALPANAIVLDVDGGEGLASLSGKHLPPTVCARTGRGYHYYFRIPKGAARNATGLRPGLDVKTAGGYVLAPPSRHESGTEYEWVDCLAPGEIPIAECPQWLRALLRERKPSPTPRFAQGELEVIPQGRRNTTLTSYAGRLRFLGMTYQEMLSVLQLHNRTCCKPPLGDGEVRSIVRSVSGYAAGPVRVDRKIVNADIGDGAKVLAALLSAGVLDDEIAAAAGVSQRTVERWWKELRAAKLETAARTPSRRHVRVPRGMLLDPELSTGVKATAMILAAHMNDGRGQVGQEALAEARGTRRATISEHVAALEAEGYLIVSREAYCGVKKRRRHCNRYRWMDAEMADDRLTERQQPQVDDTKRTLSRARQNPYVNPKPFGGAFGDGSEAVRREPLSRNRLYAELHGGPEGAVGRKKAADELPNEDAADEILVREISRDRGLQAGYVRELLKRHGASAVCESLSCCPSSSST